MGGWDPRRDSAKEKKMVPEGALDSLLGWLTTVLVSKVQLLGGVRADVEFIKDEMESMNSLLLHLTDAQHRDHQMRTEAKLGPAVSDGRSERKLEAMALETLMIQAEMADEDVPFEVAPAAGDTTTVFDSLVSLDEWSESHGSDARVTLVEAMHPAARLVAALRGGGRTDGHRCAVGESAQHGGRFKVRKTCRCDKALGRRPREQSWPSLTDRGVDEGGEAEAEVVWGGGGRRSCRSDAEEREPEVRVAAGGDGVGEDLGDAMELAAVRSSSRSKKEKGRNRIQRREGMRGDENQVKLVA
uniref:Disease resistance N-terminal domain-containing protein n=1 Tax=Oryza punctata TaxID=4537 RepID=A0A0E0MHT1_ORYPU